MCFRLRKQVELSLTNDLLGCEGVTATDSCLTFFFFCPTGVELIQWNATFQTMQDKDLRVNKWMGITTNCHEGANIWWNKNTISLVLQH